ncbi:MAG TPA: 16S rRNA (cytidine(1402)-2'-O)-methyltransferase [Pseudomonadales bacterium]|nr:16S rRNA (cytidine(1402)-2'-O)-methyltransferase [Pseudomonadales bacterium]
MAGVLNVVATPIGNLDDMSLRAIATLKNVDYVAAEDTRHSRKLLQHFGIDKPMLSLHEHNEQQRAKEIIGKLREGKHVALVSDAGTPLISDPGYTLVKEVRAQGFQVRPIPGSCAAIAALSVSGLATDKFQFEGFLPASASARRQRLIALSRHTNTLVFYEAPHRILALCQVLIECFGEDRRAVFARELTKTYETIHGGILKEQWAWLNNDANQQRGEFVVMVEGFQEEAEATSLTLEAQHLMDLLVAELPPNRAAQLAAKYFKLPKKVFYDYALGKKLDI